LYTDQAGGRYQVPAGSSIAALTWYDAPVPGGTYVAAYDEFVAAITQVVAAGNSYEIPTALAGAGAIKAVGDAAGTIIVSLKG